MGHKMRALRDSTSGPGIGSDARDFLDPTGESSMHNPSRSLWLLPVALCFLAGLRAQSSLNQRISGQAVDGTGAALPNVTVTVVNQDTSLTRAVKTNETGHYVVADL